MSPRSDCPPPAVRPIDQLRRQIESISSTAAAPREVFSTGCAALDAVLPGGGLPVGGVCEWTAAGPGCGAATMACIAAAARARAATGPVLVIDPEDSFHLPAAVALGIDAASVIHCRTAGDRRASVWAIDQSLRCGGVAAVLAVLPWRLNDRDGRRLQLAAEAGGTPAMLVRAHPDGHGAVGSFASVRTRVWPVTPPMIDDSPAMSDRTLRVQIQRASGLKSMPGGVVQIAASGVPRWVTPSWEADRERVARRPAAVHLAAQLADPAAARRADATDAEPARRRVG